jgi:LmbE family N-acetylglucosaminyl deacetylase
VQNLKTIAASLCLLGSIAPATSAVFVVAHPDDHMLMMGPNLISDISGGYPTVVVIMTAGDAANGVGDNAGFANNDYQYNEFGNQYYRVRLQANMIALDSIIPGGTPTGGRAWSQATERFSAAIPAVEKWTLGNVVLYHLNLPDASNGLTSIPIGSTNSIRDITLTNRYTRETLKETVRQIIARNNRNTPNVVLNYQRPLDPNDPVEDHPHHKAVGEIVNDAIAVPGYKCIWEARWHGYVQGTAMENVPQMRDSQRRMYELAQTILVQRGNITRHGGNVPNASWMQSILVANPVAGGPQLQRGAMDAFHTNFYGKSYYDGRRQETSNCAF